MGRKFTPDLTEKQLNQVEGFGAVLSLQQIADYFGISSGAWHYLRKRQPEIDERYKRGKYKAIGSIANSLLSKARAGDTTCQIFYLKTQAGWRETERVELTTPDTVTKVELVAPKATKKK